MTTLTTDRPATTAVTAVTAVTDPLITPYLAVADARGALDWYQSALGFRLRASRSSWTTGASVTPSSSWRRTPAS